MRDISRWAAAAVAIACSFGCSLMADVMLAIGEWPLCDERGLRGGEQCFNGSAGAQATSLLAGWSSAALAAITALLAFAHVVRGGGGEREIVLTGIAAVTIGGISTLVGSV